MQRKWKLLMDYRGREKYFYFMRNDELELAIKSSKATDLLLSDKLSSLIEKKWNMVKI